MSTVEVKLIGKGFKEGDILEVEPTTRFVDNIFPRQLTTVSENNTAPLTILNFSPVDIVIAKGETIAHMAIVNYPSPATNTSIVAALTPSHTSDDEFRKIIHQNTAPEHRQSVTELVSQYRDVFVVGAEGTGYTTTMPFSISTGDAAPLAQRPYRIPVSRQKEVERQLSEMERQGIIQLSQSPWASPLVVVEKKDKSLRLCIDYRRLNAVTKGDSFPLPSIEELLVKTQKSAYFSTLDLKSGYHQVALEESAKPKTAFLANDRLYEYNVLPSGLKNAPGISQG